MIKQEKKLLVKTLQHIGAILLFLLLTFVYFSPAFKGKVLQQGDVHQFEGMSHELSEYYHKEGVASAWTGSMFSGMPAYQIGIWGSNPNLLEYVEKPLNALGHTNAGPVFAGMLMAYILFVVMGFGFIPSVLGAIAYSLSSYNIVIIEAGHVTKAWAIAYMPLIVASLLVMFRKKYLLGGLLMALGLALQIKSNHLQVTYYTGILCVILYAGLIIKTVKNKDIKGLLKATGVLAAAVVLACLCNIASFYGNYEMAQESTRGKSELSQPSQSEKQSSGLDKDYAFAWSYGKSETLSLLIPNIHGGESGGKLGPSSNIYNQLRNNGQQLPADGVEGMPTYWGDQPFTQGSVYFGAIICFLFVLGMIIIKNNLKWVLLSATILFIFLSWGRHFDAFNSLFFYHFPLYSKFRTVSMALVIPALTMIIVAVWALKEFFAEGMDKKKQLKALYISGGITAGLCLFFWLLPDFFFNFTTDSDAQWKTQYPDWFYNSILQDRKDLLTADALRSFLFIAATALILWASTKVNMKKETLALGCVSIITVLVLADLWSVDKRYLHHDMWQTKSVYSANKFTKSMADNMILEDRSPSYRVLNLRDPFNESSTSYYHKSIGGYHAAKLKRYQELIENRLQKEIMQIIQSFNSQNPDSIVASFEGLTALNMLNAKYIIYNPGQAPLVNPYRLDNAWFVQNYSFVNNADEEIVALNTINPQMTAVVDKKFENDLKGLAITPDSTASITMTGYKPDRVTYKAKVASEQLAVFSEIYYANGWEAYIDGKPVTHFRADWTLRALRIPAGEHEIEFKFIPHGYYTARTVSMASSALLILLLLGSVVMIIRRKGTPVE